MSLTYGQSARWLEGARLDWDDLLSVPRGKTPLIIINIEHLPKEQHPWVVSQVVTSLFNWCAGQPPTPGRPRVGLVIDELAGEGGRNSLLPHLTYTSASGTALRTALRKGRHVGLGLLCGTQSPSDVDGRSFTFFNTVFAGKLKTAHDVKLALSGGGMNEDRLKKIAPIVKSASAPKMFLVRHNGWCDSIKVRWLGTIHSRIERNQIPNLYKTGILKRSTKTISANHRWSYIGPHLHDHLGNLVVAISRTGNTLITALVDSVGAGSTTHSAPLTTEGILRTTLWIGKASRNREVRMVCRDAEEQVRLLRLVAEAGVELPDSSHPWCAMPAFDQSDGAGMVHAIHEVIRRDGVLAPIPKRVAAA